jgi:hypothetical protein
VSSAIAGRCRLLWRTRTLRQEDKNAFLGCRRPRRHLGTSTSMTTALAGLLGFAMPERDDREKVEQNASMQAPDRSRSQAVWSGSEEGHCRPKRRDGAGGLGSI